jgi:hypothetical protein
MDFSLDPANGNKVNGKGHKTVEAVENSWWVAVAGLVGIKIGGRLTNGAESEQM